ncbi:MAG TPA: PQQ-dependent sugar dehydrogenase [Longimicrobiales bacterium]|nr:PQQ-dependent sugar dehydrogenase [Longimicrobiales bacterium]
MVALAVVVLAGCDLSTAPPGGGGNGGGGTRLELQTVVQGLDQPLDLTTAPGDPRLFVVEKPGTIRVLENGTLLPTPFLDLTGRVGNAGPEQGLLGLAFHPDYAANGRFFVSYTGVDGSSTVEEYSADPGSSEADPASASLVLRVEQPQPNHNGGHLAFGPDGMLYLGLGDGGGEGDPEEHGQDLGTLLGTILRLDVDGEAPYEIPPDNPFVDDPDARPEIWD